MKIAIPTKAQMDQVAQQAVSAFAEMMGINEVEAIESHSDSIFKLVCAYAAQEAA
tara:strand:- start:200 stop:364 length:165 start_codon:yes stop_codon:yes gene_type:complete